MRSPDIVLPNSPHLVLSFYAYLAHNAPSTADYLRASVVESAPAAAGAWGPARLRPRWSGRSSGPTQTGMQRGSFTWPTSARDWRQTVHLLVEAADGATQNIVEAALDDVQITLTQPLAVALDSFYAEPAADAIRLSWETLSETDTAGFALHRSLTEDGEQLQLVASVPAQATGQHGGRRRAFRASALPGQSYDYWLGDEIAGQRRQHPARPRQRSHGPPTAAALSTLQASSTFRPLLAANVRRRFARPLVAAGRRRETGSPSVVSGCMDSRAS